MLGLQFAPRRKSSYPLIARTTSATGPIIQAPLQVAEKCEIPPERTRQFPNLILRLAKKIEVSDSPTTMAKRFFAMQRPPLGNCITFLRRRASFSASTLMACAPRLVHH